MPRRGAEAITNSADVLDSRDIIARIDELESERQELSDAADEAKDAIDDYEGDLTGEAFGKLHDAHDAAMKALNEWDETDEGQELKALRELADQAEGYADDWRHGATLVRDSYFKEYAQQYADDIGAIDASASWPLNCIDWDQAAEELKSDYTAVEFDGVTYWVR